MQSFCILFGAGNRGGWGKVYSRQYVSGKMHCNMISPLLYTAGYRKQDLDLDEYILDLFV